MFHFDCYLLPQLDVHETGCEEEQDIKDLNIHTTVVTFKDDYWYQPKLSTHLVRTDRWQQKMQLETNAKDDSMNETCLRRVLETNLFSSRDIGSLMLTSKQIYVELTHIAHKEIRQNYAQCRTRAIVRYHKDVDFTTNMAEQRNLSDFVHKCENIGRIDPTAKLTEGETKEGETKEENIFQLKKLNMTSNSLCSFPWTEDLSDIASKPTEIWLYVALHCPWIESITETIQDRCECRSTELKYQAEDPEDPEGTPCTIVETKTDEDSYGFGRCTCDLHSGERGPTLHFRGMTCNATYALNDAQAQVPITVYTQSYNDLIFIRNDPDARSMRRIDDCDRDRLYCEDQQTEDEKRLYRQKKSSSSSCSDEEEDEESDDNHDSVQCEVCRHVHFSDGFGIPGGGGICIRGCVDTVWSCCGIFGKFMIL